MKHWVKVLSIFFLLSLIFLPKNIFAHPGNTASDGCHYCRTNCDKWGVPWNERHCHGGGTVEKVQAAPPTSIPQPSTPIPTNSPQVLGIKTTGTEKSSSNGLGTLAILSWVIFGGYKLIKKFKNKQ